MSAVLLVAAAVIALNGDAWRLDGEPVSVPHTWNADAGARRLRFAQRGISSFRPGEPLQVYRAKTGELVATLHVEGAEIVSGASGRRCDVTVRDKEGNFAR